MRRNTIQDFYRKITRKANGCIEWEGRRFGKFYGGFVYEGKLYYAHRFLWERINGQVPKGKELHHLCLNRLCINPRHLKLVTRKEHCVEHPRWNTFKTHCGRGHEFTEENTYHWNGKRICRECRRIKDRLIVKKFLYKRTPEGRKRILRQNHT